MGWEFRPDALGIGARHTAAVVAGVPIVGQAATARTRSASARPVSAASVCARVRTRSASSSSPAIAGVTAASVSSASMSVTSAPSTGPKICCRYGVAWSQPARGVPGP